MPPGQESCTPSQGMSHRAMLQWARQCAPWLQVTVQAVEPRQSISQVEPAAQVVEHWIEVHW